MINKLSDPLDKIQVDEVVSKLEEAVRAIYKSDFDFETKLGEFTDIELNILKNLVDIEALKKLSGNDLEKSLNSLINDIRSLEKINILTAIELTREHKESILSLISKRYGSNYVVNFKTDKSVIAGLIIEKSGKYEDFSIKNLVKKAFAELSV